MHKAGCEEPPGSHNPLSAGRVVTRCHQVSPHARCSSPIPPTCQEVSGSNNAPIVSPPLQEVALPGFFEGVHLISRNFSRVCPPEMDTREEVSLWPRVIWHGKFCRLHPPQFRVKKGCSSCFVALGSWLTKDIRRIPRRSVGGLQQQLSSAEKLKLLSGIPSSVAIQRSEHLWWVFQQVSCTRAASR